MKVLGEEAFYATCASIGVHVSLSEIDRVCQLAFRSGTANVHLKAGQPTILRVDGELQSVESAPLTPDLLVEMCTPLLDDRHKEEFLECAVPTFAHLIILKEQQHRFRVNLFQQNGSMSFVALSVDPIVPPLESLNLPPVMERICKIHQGMILVTGMTGTGKKPQLPRCWIGSTRTTESTSSRSKIQLSSFLTTTNH